MQKHMQTNSRKSGINTKNSCKTLSNKKEAKNKKLMQNFFQTKNHKNNPGKRHANKKLQKNHTKLAHFTIIS